LTRRSLLQAGVGAAAVALTGYAVERRSAQTKPAEVFVAKAARYDGDLAGVILSGLRELGIAPAMVRGRRILLKPNLVERRSYGSAQPGFWWPKVTGIAATRCSFWTTPAWARFCGKTGSPSST
jgi:hypothetical protein